MCARCTRFMRRMGMPTCDDHECGKADNVSNGHVPTMPQPESDRFRFGIRIRKCNPRCRAEPDHRPTKSDGISERAPVVATLLSASAVSGMLSKTADTKPRPSAVCHEALGNLSTGINVAHKTSDSKK